MDPTDEILDIIHEGGPDTLSRIAEIVCGCEKQTQTLTDEQIDRIAENCAKSMPDGIRGFCKTWGWRQFARELLDVCAGYRRGEWPTPDDDESFDTVIAAYASACTHSNSAGMRAGYIRLRAMCEGQPRATDRYPQGGDPSGLRGEAIEPGPKDAPESDSSKSASTLTDPEGAS